MTLTAAINTAEKTRSEQLFDAYQQFQQDNSIADKSIDGFLKFTKEKNINLNINELVIRDIYNNLSKPEKKEEITNTIEKLSQSTANVNEADVQKVQEATTEHQKEMKEITEKTKEVTEEKVDRLTGLLKLQDALEEFKKDPRYAKKQGRAFFISFLKEKKAKANDTTDTYYGFNANEIVLGEDGTMKKPTLESVKNEEKINPATENKVNVSEEKAETPEEKTLTITKDRLKQSIGRYIDRINAVKKAKEGEKKALEADIAALKDQIKKEKKAYEDAKSLLLGNTNYKTEELSRISTRWIRFGKKTVQGGVVTRTLTERLQFSTIRRRMTVNKLVKKFNEFGSDHIKGVRFIMGFDKSRFLRYTGIKVATGVDILGGKMGMQMNPQQFHERFNRGKKNIFDILDKGEKTPEEQKVIDAIKKRIQYYGYAYARQRATARTDPFIQAEKNAKPEERIIAAQTKESKLNIPAEQKQELLTIGVN